MLIKPNLPPQAISSMSISTICTPAASSMFAAFTRSCTAFSRQYQNVFHSRGIFPIGCLVAGASPRRSRTGATSFARPPVTTRPAVAVASPVRTSSTICSTAKPCARMIASVAPSREAASNSKRAAAVGPGIVAQMAKRGERGIGGREHARVYPNARSDAAAASKTNARVGLQWCHSLGKSVCFSMCAGSAYWCHLSAKSFAISTNGLIRSESRWGAVLSPTIAHTIR